MKKTFLPLLAFGILPCFAAGAAEIAVGDGKASDVAISIYNSDLAFVREVRQAEFTAGENAVAFEGVARSLRPETVQISAPGATVVEQNYDFNLINLSNILQEYVGKPVKTALLNPATGETKFDTATVVTADGGQPVLQFSYGIETDFPGRLVFDQVPAHLRKKPTMAAVMKAEKAGAAPVRLSYLTDGVSWRADYIANVAGKDTMSLAGMITLVNNSGADYKDALVQVVAGNVSTQAYGGGIRPAMARGAMMKGMMNDAVYEMAAAPMPESEAVGGGDHYLYTLPGRTTVKDMQSKQVSLMSRDGVKFEKVYKLQSPLSMYFGARGQEFEKAHPAVAFKIANKAENGLGLPLPRGNVRFYQTDSKGNAQFIGVSALEHLGAGEEAELALGTSFDISAKGKIAGLTPVSEKVSDVKFEVVFKNAKDEAVNVAFTQPVSGRFEAIEETLKSEKKNSATAKWVVAIPAKGEFTLEATLRIYRD